MDNITTIFRRSVDQKKSGRVGNMEIEDLQVQLNKAKEDADYWRLAYDKLIRHIENQDSYIRHLEDTAWNIKPK